MTHIFHEALDYPSTNHDEVVTLLKRREAITVVLESLPSAEALEFRLRRSRIVIYSALVVCLVAGVLTVANILGEWPQVFAGIALAADLIVFTFYIRSQDQLDKRLRFRTAMVSINHSLDQLRSYQNPETLAALSDAEVLDILTVRQSPGLTRIVTVIALLTAAMVLSMTIMTISERF